MTTGLFPSERRRWPRADFSAMAYVFSESVSSGIYGVKNLSAGGALLVGDSSFVPGTYLRVSLELPKRRLINVDARVLRTQTDACGESAFAVAFQISNPRIEDTIHDAVLARLEEIRASRISSVLVVDECERVRRALVRDLEALNHRVVLAANRTDAIRCLRGSVNRIDTALVDFFTGQPDGIGLLAYLADKYPGIRRVLMMSREALASQLEFERASNLAHAVLRKPWEMASLSAAVIPTRAGLDSDQDPADTTTKGAAL